MNSQNAAPRELLRTSPFSYECRACSRCCHGYRIRVNPFESLTLARHLDMGTTEFRQRFLDADSMLRHEGEAERCVFLGAKGCTVHPARPLACRLYPLGRSATSCGDERFFQISPHPQTEGIYGDGGTVGQYLAEQGADAFIAAAARYLELYCRCVSALGVTPDLAAGDGDGCGELLDADYVIAKYLPGNEDGRLAPTDAMNLHIQALEALLLKPQRNTHEQVETGD
jgi:Fe-S-cluster containining protein